MVRVLRIKDTEKGNENNNMEEINRKLTEITNIWNNFILEQKYFRNKLKFNNQKETNYYGDIMRYLCDTFSIVEKHEIKKEMQGDFDDYIFYVIGFLQMLYVQQDLVDELRIIFKLSSSNSENRKTIRNLRNELVGHPISRDKKNKLLSTVFWGENLSFNNINYIRYNEGEIIGSENISVNIDTLIGVHREYLSNSFSEILKKEKKMIKIYKRELSNLIKMIKNDKSSKNYLEDIIILATRYVSNLGNYSYTFSHEYAKKAERKKNLAKRYLYYLEYYYSVIEKTCDELISLCDEYLMPKVYEKSDDEEKIIDNIMLVSNVNNNPIKIYHYYFQKLSERKHPKFIELLIKENDDFEVLEELNRMKNVFYDDNQFEYYCSFIYVEKLLGMSH
jgi:hypothetical protein